MAGGESVNNDWRARFSIGGEGVRSRRYRLETIYTTVQFNEDVKIKIYQNGDENVRARVAANGLLAVGEGQAGEACAQPVNPDARDYFVEAAITVNGQGLPICSPQAGIFVVAYLLAARANVRVALSSRVI